MSLARATEFAFRGRLADAARLLDSLDASASDTIWLRAYLAAARGDFARAERLAREVIRAPRASTETKARAAITLGSVLRQGDRHTEARVVDAAALRTARGDDLRAHLLIGLAADAVGLGRLADVDAALGRLPSSARDWRVRVRLRWVRCERELLAGRPGAAAGHARAAVALATRYRAARHEAKSHLFLGAALLVAATRRPRREDLVREAERSLRRSRSVADRIGARPIAAVASDLLGRSGRAKRR